jgi:hypothetical protein
VMRAVPWASLKVCFWWCSGRDGIGRDRHRGKLSTGARYKRRRAGLGVYTVAVWTVSLSVLLSSSPSLLHLLGRLNKRFLLLLLHHVLSAPHGVLLQYKGVVLEYFLEVLCLGGRSHLGESSGFDL